MTIKGTLKVIKRRVNSKLMEARNIEKVSQQQTKQVSLTGSRVCSRNRKVENVIIRLRRAAEGSGS